MNYSCDVDYSLSTVLYKTQQSGAARAAAAGAAGGSAAAAGLPSDPFLFEKATTTATTAPLATPIPPPKPTAMSLLAAKSALHRNHKSTATSPPTKKKNASTTSKHRTPQKQREYLRDLFADFAMPSFGTDEEEQVPMEGGRREVVGEEECNVVASVPAPPNRCSNNRTVGRQGRSSARRTKRRTSLGHINLKEPSSAAAARSLAVEDETTETYFDVTDRGDEEDVFEIRPVSPRRSKANKKPPSSKDGTRSLPSSSEARARKKSSPSPSRKHRGEGGRSDAAKGTRGSGRRAPVGDSGGQRSASPARRSTLHHNSSGGRVASRRRMSTSAVSATERDQLQQNPTVPRSNSKQQRRASTTVDDSKYRQQRQQQQHERRPKNLRRRSLSPAKQLRGDIAMTSSSNPVALALAL